MTDPSRREVVTISMDDLAKVLGRADGARLMYVHHDMITNMVQLGFVGGTTSLPVVEHSQATVERWDAQFDANGDPVVAGRWELRVTADGADMISTRECQAALNHFAKDWTGEPRLPPGHPVEQAPIWLVLDHVDRPMRTGFTLEDASQAARQVVGGSSWAELKQAGFSMVRAMISWPAPRETAEARPPAAQGGDDDL